MEARDLFYARVSLRKPVEGHAVGEYGTVVGYADDTVQVVMDEGAPDEPVWAHYQEGVELVASPEEAQRKEQ